MSHTNRHKRHRSSAQQQRFNFEEGFHELPGRQSPNPHSEASNRTSLELAPQVYENQNVVVGLIGLNQIWPDVLIGHHLSDGSDASVPHLHQPVSHVMNVPEMHAMLPLPSTFAYMLHTLSTHSGMETHMFPRDAHTHARVLYPYNDQTQSFGYSKYIHGQNPQLTHECVSNVEYLTLHYRSGIDDLALSQPLFNTENAPNRPHPLSSTSPSKAYRHTKNVSIATHLGMFSLNEHPNEGLSQQHEYPIEGLSRQHEYHQLDTQSSEPQSEEEPENEASPIEASSIDKAKLVNDVADRILHDMVNVDPEDLNLFLLSTLRNLGTTPPLDDFYNLLYNNESGYSALRQPRIDASPTPTSSEALQVLQRMLEVFRDPLVLLTYCPQIDVSESRLLNVNCHELFRLFLAIKILFDTLVEAHESAVEEMNTIPRHTIYKVYYILCQKLILRYTSASNSISLQQKLILGRSRLGRLVKLVYPKLTSKRLGRRGESKFTYMGVRWNSAIVTPEVMDLSEYDLTKLTTHFKHERWRMSHRQQQHPSKQKQQKPQKQLQQLQHQQIQPLNQPLQLQEPLQEPLQQQQQYVHHEQHDYGQNYAYRHDSTGQVLISEEGFDKYNHRNEYANEQKQQQSIHQPRTTFVGPATRLPLQGLSPLALVANPTNIETTISWWGAALHHSLNWLHDHVDISLRGDQIEMCHVDNHSWLVQNLIRHTSVIVNSPAYIERDYLHLFLVFIAQLMPAILGHGTFTYTQNMRQVVSQFAPVGVDQMDVRAFVAAVRRMVNVADVLALLLRVEPEVLLAMRRETEVDDSEELTKGSILDTYGVDMFNTETFDVKQDVPLLKSSPRDLLPNNNHFGTDTLMVVQNAIVHTLQAYRLLIPDSTMADARAIALRLCQSFSRVLDFMIAENNSSTEGSLQDSAAEVSQMLVQLVHEDILVGQLAQCPIFVVRDVVTYASNQMLAHGYQTHGDASLTFRPWWLIATYVQEYIALVCEVVGLHEKSVS